MAWWDDAVVYQVYPRSFQDTTGSGEGDLPGITSRLDHVAWLGADALDPLLKDSQLRDDPPAAGPAALPLHAERDALEHAHSRNAPDIGTALAQLLAAVVDRLLVGEAYVPTRDLPPYLEHLDVCFGFELFHAPWDAARLRAAIDSAAAVGPKRVGWV